ncbi:STAS domain-containing protein [Streptomonospora litoralis]|uniref:Anti-sigma factor antagonist n=1 Tax=Streptomonospora litoralis TaxID=2498135 RepID=A0A4P6Q5A2_9ACTN|nr:STAS domain-containing protein [Streptomonospora litoralis]QBI55906.1 Putative anti-sigma factor antagonist [Streptomonospora litoralis]
MASLKITRRDRDDCVVLAPSGEIDMAAEDQFHRAVLAAVDDRPQGRLVLDFSRLVFIDSSGLRVLIQAHKATKAAGGSLAIAAASERIARILHVTAIDTRVAVFPTVEAALAAAQESSSAG